MYRRSSRKQTGTGKPCHSGCVCASVNTSCRVTVCRVTLIPFDEVEGRF